eukprot:TRINITY_DN9380_c0_g1_i1.p1 TRINITY_DN9380_c0_g1~~TRINITY_DN9380_c0_g1_i1.p1  ORF type:complete len:732 (+),score=173.01 TRINITY_DN9380_c0_g1_i1:85-2196(+)
MPEPQPDADGRRMPGRSPALPLPASPAGCADAGCAPRCSPSPPAVSSRPCASEQQHAGDGDDGDAALLERKSTRQRLCAESDHGCSDGAPSRRSSSPVYTPVQTPPHCSTANGHTQGDDLLMRKARRQSVHGPGSSGSARRDPAAEDSAPSGYSLPAAAAAHASGSAPHALSDASAALRRRAEALRADAEALDRAGRDLSQREALQGDALAVCEGLQLRVLELEEELRRANAAGRGSYVPHSHVDSAAGVPAGLLGQLGALRRELQEQRELVRRYCAAAGEEARRAAEHAAAAVASFAAEAGEMVRHARSRLEESETERAALLQRLLDLRGQVRVIARVRPALPGEPLVAACAADAAARRGQRWGSSVTVTAPGYAGGSGPRTLSFCTDTAMGPEAAQTDVYSEVDGLAVSVVDGYCCCIVAYGQTGSGKTHTMLGTPDDPGVAPRLIDEILRRIRAEEGTDVAGRFSVSASAEEVYCDVVYDLFGEGDLEERKVALLRPARVLPLHSSGRDVAALIGHAVQYRWTGASHRNARSSRSHLVITVRVEDRATERCGELRLVDLAGSERLPTGPGHMAAALSSTVRETQHINRSLTALGDVIEALAAGSPHVPYRNSRLTHLLAPSLGDGAKVVMFIMLSPASDSVQESLRSLQFGQRVRAVRLGEARQGQLVQQRQGRRHSSGSRPMYRSRSAPNRVSLGLQPH